MIEINKVSKDFLIPHEKRETLFENLTGMIKGNLYYEKFSALKEIELTVAPGQFTAVIGGNGSGKSTLLKILAKIMVPTSGTVKVTGQPVPLLELGLGFQPDLSARENVILYGVLMGITRRELEIRLKSIFEFAEVEKFIDMPLKNYSSGMQARLAFATAVQTDGDIYLVDEVLAVGDMSFFGKCLEVFTNIKKSGRTLVLVTHDLNLAAGFCEQALYLSGGVQKFYGPTAEAIACYQQDQAAIIRRDGG